MIHEQRFENWTHDKILEYLKTTGNFNSPSINYYLRVNRIPFSIITPPYIQTNPFLQPTTPAPNYGITTPEYRTITPNPETSLTAPIPPKNDQLIDWPRSGPVQTVAFFGDRRKEPDRTVQIIGTVVWSEKYGPV